MGREDFASQLKLNARERLGLIVWDYHELSEASMSRMTMYNPCHPGALIREFLGDMQVGEAARRLKIARFPQAA